MSKQDLHAPGILQPAPEGFLDEDIVGAISRQGIDPQRRKLLKSSFLGALATTLAPSVLADGDPDILELPSWSRQLGKAVAHNPYGQPSPYEQSIIRRQSPGLTQTTQSSVSFSPLQGMFGIITASGLHFERHHQGWVDIDPARHRLMINGLVGTTKIYTLSDLMRMPSVSRIHFIECGANTGMEWGNSAVPTVQYTHGMLSCSEFTGIPLSLLLADAGFDEKKARYVLAEGADGSSMTRTIDIERALDDVIVVYGMNGEMLRPENGYPLRLVVPGVQGVSSVKWLRRIEVGDQPWNTKDEAVHYVDLMPDGQHRQFTSIQEVKSVITTPSGGQQLLKHGYYNISGLAWSGRGKIEGVDVSYDGGVNWYPARLETPVLSKALSRFNIPWVWNGSSALLQSRAIDSSGQVQPLLRQLRDVRGSRSVYHNNAIQTWQVQENGEVANVQLG